MSTGGPPPHVVIAQLAVVFVIAAAGVALLAHLVLRLTARRWGERAARRGMVIAGLAALALAVTFLAAEAARVMLAPDGQNEEVAFAGLVLGAGLLARGAWRERRRDAG